MGELGELLNAPVALPLWQIFAMMAVIGGSAWLNGWCKGKGIEP